ncbi:vacuolar protein-sorting-associated protein 37 homolog 1-like isoform X1 [Cynara cardunculus var. scolymus]|uniref:vacuolar protein-sorting-associated protein 37 homolog 1-like isoform X1 n=1 Tax=Cynara cardunculus var. scolymus TaxID=59895 RepID=UPI000D62330B|nr:vacuolar protein-sorting-associated protein 37 homolog 1-like isoform X1 [Cynara cardunculus var. scolymus]
MLLTFRGSQEQQVDPRPQEITTNSWYPPSVVSSPSSSNPATPNSSNSDTHTQRVGDRSHLSSPVSPTEAAGIIVYLKDKSVDELRKLLSNQEAYQQFLLSIDPVRTQNNVRNELRNETMQLARENLEKEPQITELRNQCMIIRTTELASAEEKLNDLTKRKAEILKYYSPGSLLHKLQECMDKTDKESEALHEQLLGKEIDLATFVQKYKQLRNVYHKRSLTYLAAKTSLGG